MHKHRGDPLISVVIPAFNEESRYLREALESIYKDQWEAFEVIVVDDGSTDHTRKIIAEFPDVRYFYQDNQGDAAARNTGIGLAKGKIIAFLDSDDIWLPGRFKRSWDYLNAHPEVQYLLGQAMMFLQEGHQKPEHIREEWLRAPVDSSATNVLTARKTCFETVGLFNTSYKKNSDTEWLLRAAEKKVCMARLPFPVIRRRIHGGNLSNTTIEEYKSVVFSMVREAIQRKRENT